MKTIKFFLSIILCLFTSLTMWAQSDALYIYRNDGQFNAFSDVDIDSITYSRFDADSLYHTNWQMQVVHTVDSIYRIPLEVIDSVAFKPLEPILNSEVFPMTAEHAPYILSADTLTFTMSLTTPKELRPRKGNIVAASYDCEAFPNGIIAKVVSVEETNTGYVYLCEPASLDDVYDQIIYHGVVGVSGQETRVSGKVGKILWNETFNKKFSYSGTTTNFSVQDVAAFEITLQKTLGNPMYSKIIVANNIKMNIDFCAESEASIVPNPVQLGSTVTCGRIAVPNFPLIWFSPQLKLFGYFEEHGSVKLNLAGYMSRRDKVEMTYTNEQWSFEYTPTVESGVDVASLSMDGTAEIGLQPEIRLALNGSPTCIGLSFRHGLKQSCNLKFDALDYMASGTYDAIKNSTFQTSVTRSASLFAQSGLLEKNAARGEFSLMNIETPLKTHYLLPLFSSTQKISINGNNHTMGVNVDRDLLFPVQIGMAIYDKSDNLKECKYNSVEYQYRNEWPFNYLSETFEGIETGTAYTCYPMVKILGHDLRATPKVGLGTGNIVSFEKTDAPRYLTSSEGEKYVSFSFKAQVNVGLPENVTEWGFLIRTLEDDEKDYGWMWKASNLTETTFVGIVNLPVSDLDKIDRSNFIASKKMSAYIYYITPETEEGHHRMLSTPQEVEFVYDDKPTIYFTDFVLGETEPYSDEDGRDLKTHYTNEFSVRGSLFADEIFIHRKGNVDNSSKQPLAYDFIGDYDGYRRNGFFNYWSKYEKPVSNGYIYLGITANGTDYYSSNYILVDWNNRSFTLEGEASSNSTTRAMPVSVNSNAQATGVIVEGEFKVLEELESVDFTPIMEKVESMPILMPYMDGETY